MLRVEPPSTAALRNLANGLCGLALTTSFALIYLAVGVLIGAVIEQ